MRPIRNAAAAPHYRALLAVVIGAHVAAIGLGSLQTMPGRPRGELPLRDTPLSIALISPPQTLPAAPRTSPPEAAKPAAPRAQQPASQKIEATNSLLPSPLSGATAEPWQAPHTPASPTAEAPLTQARFDADYLRNPAPPYPPLSRRMGEEGRVILRVLVSPEGQAEQVDIKTSSGSQRLDEAARKTVLGWRFVPAKRGDTPTASWVLVPINFKLEN